MWSKNNFIEKYRLKELKMPFWKKDSVKKGPVKQDSSDSSSTGVNGDGGKSKEKVDYKARLQHKQYLVSNICKNDISISNNSIVRIN